MPKDVLSKTKIGGEANTQKRADDERRRIQREIDDIWTAEVAVVHSYDFRQQRVDVLLKTQPGMPLIENVPIAWQQGDLKLIHNLPSRTDGTDDPPAVGVLQFFRSTAVGVFDDAQIRNMGTGLKHRGQRPVFYPAGRLRNEFPSSVENPNAGDSDTDEVGPDDTALIHDSGSHITFKANGDIHIHADGDLLVSDGDKGSADAKAIARDGDTVSNPSTTDGTIQASGSVEST